MTTTYIIENSATSCYLRRLDESHIRGSVFNYEFEQARHFNTFDEANTAAERLTVAFCANMTVHPVTAE